MCGFPPNALWVDTAGEELRRQCNLAPGSFLARTPIVYSLYLVPRDLDTSQPLDSYESPIYIGYSRSHDIYCENVPGVWALVDLRTVMTHPEDDSSGVTYSIVLV